MSEVLDKFILFLKDTDAGEMYITGVAGTGKTTSLAEVLEYCDKNEIECITTAYTHKACSVLASKLPETAKIATLHSFLSKRPTINDEATVIAHVDGNRQHGKPEEVAVLFIDEFSMVGERDFLSISELMYDLEGEIKMKVVYIGDPNQLPPVKDMKAVTPKGKYWVKLTQVHRQALGNPLIKTLLDLNDYINGVEPKPLEEHTRFKRGVDLEAEYKKCNKFKVALAYTNERVEDLNASIEGKMLPEVGDRLFCPTLRQYFTLVEISDSSTGIVNIAGKLLELDSKYKELEKLHQIGQVVFYTVEDEAGNELPLAGVFGHKSFLNVQQMLADNAVTLNKQIKNEFDITPRSWAEQNRDSSLAKDRAKAWSMYLAFKNNVVCLDFAHATTVHKAQGSTYDTVFIDMKDMARCADKDYNMYLKLLYVAISRASEMVYSN